MGINSSIHDDIDRLYHWQPFDAGRLEKILLDRSVYCSNPADFNDPWDGKPHFNTDLLQDLPDFEKMIHYTIDIFRRQFPTKPEAEIIKTEAKLRNDPLAFKKVIEATSQDMANGISRVFRVYCLGPSVENLLMWSHYADGHKGICIEFNTQNEVICNALRVEYRKDYPKWRLDDSANRLDVLLTKADVWEYEQEYRLICQEIGSTKSQGNLTTKNDFLKLPDNAMLSVIVGCNGPYEEVRNLVAKVAPGIRVRRAIYVPNRFELTIV